MPSSPREDLMKFETDRIKALQEERLHIQKKTFTKWMNSFLSKASLDVEDLFTDLADGRHLLRLLEIISSEKLGKPNNGRMRVHQIENVNLSLSFLHSKVRLESIGAEDIVDGNPRLILGLLWTIILRFQIQDIEIEVNESDESSEKKSAKDALLLWCQRRTSGYTGVNVHDFSSSWQSGLAFNALIHSHLPHLFDFSSLEPEAHIDNLNHAFRVAEQELGVAQLLDSEDVDTQRPDEKSVMTYISCLYHVFAKMKNQQKSGSRIANITARLMEVDRMISNYESLTSHLLLWIGQQIRKLSDTDLPNFLTGLQKEMMHFREYLTGEKPPKYTERVEVEALLFSIRTKTKALGQPPYTPTEGKLVQDIENAWSELEKAEHRREAYLREEIRRLERLEHMAFRFEKKAQQIDQMTCQHENYLMTAAAEGRESVEQVIFSIKKHEAFEKFLLTQDERLTSLQDSGQKLIQERFYDSDAIKSRMDEVSDRRLAVKENSSRRRLALQQMLLLAQFRRQVEEAETWIDEKTKSLAATASLETSAKHQKHEALVVELHIHKKDIELIRHTGQTLLASEHDASDQISEQMHRLLSRVQDFEHLLDAEIFRWEADQLEAWIEAESRCLQLLSSEDSIAAVEDMMKRQKELEQVLVAHEEKFNSLQRVTLIEQVYEKEWKALLEERQRVEDKLREELRRQLEEQQAHVERLSAEKELRLKHNVLAMGKSEVSESQTSVHIPGVAMEGMMERKHELTTGGKRAGFRSWKAYHTVLCDRTAVLQFFRDRQGFFHNIPASAPVSLCGGCVSRSPHPKKQHCFRLKLSDSSEYVFSAPDDDSLEEWLSHISVFASTSVEERDSAGDENGCNQDDIRSPDGTNDAIYSTSGHSNGKTNGQNVQQVSPGHHLPSQATNGSRKTMPPTQSSEPNEKSGCEPAHVHHKGNRDAPPLPPPHFSNKSARGPPPPPPLRTVTIGEDAVAGRTGDKGGITRTTSEANGFEQQTRRVTHSLSQEGLHASRRRDPDWRQSLPSHDGNGSSGDTTPRSLITTTRTISSPVIPLHGNLLPPHIMTSTAEIQLQDQSAGRPLRPPSAPHHSAGSETSGLKSKKKGVMSLFKRNK